MADKSITVARRHKKERVGPEVGEANVEQVAELQKAFDEISLSSSRIVKSLERLNTLALETYSELHAARTALAGRDAVNVVA